MHNKLVIVGPLILSLLASSADAECSSNTSFDTCTSGSCKWCWVQGGPSAGGELACQEANTSLTSCVDATALNNVEDRWSWIYTNVIQTSLVPEQDLPKAIKFCTNSNESVYGGSSSAGSDTGFFCPYGQPEDVTVTDWSQNRCFASAQSVASCKGDADIDKEVTCNGLGRTCALCTANTDCKFLYQGSNIVCTASGISGATNKCCSKTTEGKTLDSCTSLSPACSWCYSSTTGAFLCHEPEYTVPKDLCLNNSDVDYLKSESDSIETFEKIYNYASGIAGASSPLAVSACVQEAILWDPLLAGDPPATGKYCPLSIPSPCKDTTYTSDNYCIGTADEAETEGTVSAIGTCLECTENGGQWVANQAFCTKIQGLGVGTCVDQYNAGTYDTCQTAGGEWCVRNGLIGCFPPDVAQAQYLHCISSTDAEGITAATEGSADLAYTIAVASGYSNPIDICLHPARLLNPTDSTASTSYFCPLELKCYGADPGTGTCVNNSSLAAELACLVYTDQGCEICTSYGDCKYDINTGICSTKASVAASDCKGCFRNKSFMSCKNNANCAWFYRPGKQFVCEDSAAVGPYKVTDADYVDVTQNGGEPASTYGKLLDANVESDSGHLSTFCIDAAALAGYGTANPTSFQYLPYESDPSKRCIETDETTDGGLTTFSQLGAGQYCSQFSCADCIGMRGCFFKSSVCASVNIDDALSSCPNCGRWDSCKDCLSGSCCWNSTDSECLDRGDESCDMTSPSECPGDGGAGTSSYNANVRALAAGFIVTVGVNIFLGN